MEGHLNFGMGRMVAQGKAHRWVVSVPEKKECRRETGQLKKLRPERSSESAEPQSPGVKSSLSS